MTDLADADRLAHEFMVGTEELRANTMIALAEYEIAVNTELDGDSYEQWCAMGGERPSDDAEDRFLMLHGLYVSLWRKLGAKVFFEWLSEGRREVVRLRK